MAKKSPSPVLLSAPHESALIEIRRQLNQAYALVHGARCKLVSDNQEDTVACDLLDMAEELLGDHEWINRMDELRPKGVAHG